MVPQAFGKMLNRTRLHASFAREILEDVDEDRENAEKGATQPGEVERLSGREKIILQQVMQGSSNKQIARELNIAEATVKVHIKSVLRKIRVSNRTQAAMWAIKNLSQITCAYMSLLIAGIASTG